MSSRRTSVFPLATNKVGCQCDRSCEMPCWQRVGITDTPCCAGCPPLRCYEPCATCGTQLIDCPYCHGEGEIAYNPSWRRDPQCETSAPCPTCHGDGTVPARTWDITVCVLCLEHVNDCQCDLDNWRGPEPPTMRLTVELDEAA